MLNPTMRNLFWAIWAISLVACIGTAFATGHPFLGLFCISGLIAGSIGFFGKKSPSQ
ncbi:MAG: hypothetical protein K2W82_10755 [Candidatus Obscuribacterales bacterium]|nr:hypothetical protein [Candidatus Obscuribacterales bacterium]